ncbi:inorganic diphosphatase [Marinithermus hydrothermalis]|uniref:Inorganic pyrophosphatase n=1 Tax=Marinithermus hydrothermalis (strain DSM 14884 / JCM 11576 / T1) TaxID=869210 RepID=F2NKQ4_MARHT|nr:inorganic diphosphatase [Marinithermus hydrothermalis]AEB10817.1 Inorganic pyrophosphatase [Marinithermus hydrothermalis DSM 14884]
MAKLHDLPIGDQAPDVVHMVIEVPKGSANKYEFDEATGMVKLDRVLPSAQFYPGDYGFIPQTLAEDGDPLDGIVLSTYPLLPGVLVEVRVVGLIEMEDEKGPDSKVLAVVAEDPRFNEIQDLEQVPQATRTEIAHFFETYKDLERHKGKWVKVTGWKGRADALAEIQACHERYKRGQ